MIDLLAVQENTYIAGAGALGRLMIAEPDRVVYEKEGDSTRVIELRRGDTGDADRQLRRWENLARLSHPNLLCVYEAGRSELSDVPVIYAVMDRADESLADVLSQRTLTEDEAREVLQPSLSALAYLHGQGYAAGPLHPAAVLAAGDCLKISTASVTRMEDGGQPVEDTRALGILLVRALTGAEPELNASGEPFVLQSVSEPLRGIVQHLLDSDAAARWTADQALVYLWRGVKPAAPLAHAEPPLSQAESRQARSQSEPDSPRERTGRGKWVFAVAAVALVLLAALLWPRGKPSREPVPTPVADLQPAASQPAAAQPSAPQPATPQPAASHPEPTEPARAPAAVVTAPTPDPEPPATKAPAVSRPDRQGSGWVVVVAAYVSRGPAEKRAKALAKKWSKFDVEVIEARSEKVPMLVVVGRNLSQKEADALRQRAVASGLPRDTYIKRIAEQNG